MGDGQCYYFGSDQKIALLGRTHGRKKKMELSKIHDISVLHLFGEVSFLEMDQIEKTLLSLRQANHHNVLIDMNSVDHIHYRIIKRLVHSAFEFRHRAGDLKLAGLRPEAREVIKFTGADQVLEDYATISEAILSFLNKVDSEVKIYQ